MKKETTEFGGVLAQAIDTSNSNVNQLVWKTKNGNEIKMVDMAQDELQNAYTHAHEMLYNKSEQKIGKRNRYTPGRYQVKLNIKKLISYCNAELFKRFLIHEVNLDTLNTPMKIIDVIRNYKKANGLTGEDKISTLFDHLPTEFDSLTYDLLMSACLDQLGIINRKMISPEFVISRGIWLTDAEKEELSELDENGKVRPWLEVIKERLIIPSTVALHTNANGFSYEEFRALIHLQPYPKISSLPSETLRLLRDKVFPLLDVDCDWHINKWTSIMKNIEKVAKYKGIELPKFNE